MEEHKGDKGSSGAAARLGLRLSAMSRRADGGPVGTHIPDGSVGPSTGRYAGGGEVAADREAGVESHLPDGSMSLAPTGEGHEIPPRAVARFKRACHGK
jgi:hypothetical protein